MDITGTVSYPELCFAVLCGVGILLTGKLSHLCIVDVREWHGGIIWRRVLVTRRRNNVVRLTIFVAYEVVAVLFMLAPPPERPEVAWAVEVGGMLLYYSVLAMLWNAVFDYLDRQFIVRAKADSAEYARHLDEMGLFAHGHSHAEGSHGE